MGTAGMNCNAGRTGAHQQRVIDEVQLRQQVGVGPQSVEQDLRVSWASAVGRARGGGSVGGVEMDFIGAKSGAGRISKAHVFRLVELQQIAAKEVLAVMIMLKKFWPS